MNQEAIDNTTKRNSEIYGLQPKSATNILNCEATLNDIILMGIADSDYNTFVEIIISILEKATSFTSDTTISKLIDALLPREDRYNNKRTGETLQNLANDFINSNTHFFWLTAPPTVNISLTRY